MPPQPDDRNDAHGWLRYARENLAHAEAGRAASVLNDYLCFDAQQAVEKALKAVLISRGVRFPHVHDLGELLRVIKESGITVPLGIDEVAVLNPFAVQARYPGWGEPATGDDVEQALVLARAAIDWAASIVEGRGP